MVYSSRVALEFTYVKFVEHHTPTMEEGKIGALFFINIYILILWFICLCCCFLGRRLRRDLWFGKRHKASRFLDANHLQLQFLYLSIYYYFYYLLLLFILFSKCSRDANIESKNHEDAKWGKIEGMGNFWRCSTSKKNRILISFPYWN